MAWLLHKAQSKQQGKGKRKGDTVDGVRRSPRANKGKHVKVGQPREQATQDDAECVVIVRHKGYKRTKDQRPLAKQVHVLCMYCICTVYVN